MSRCHVFIHFPSVCDACANYEQQLTCPIVGVSSTLLSNISDLSTALNYNRSGTISPGNGLPWFQSINEQCQKKIISKFPILKYWVHQDLFRVLGSNTTRN